MSKNENQEISISEIFYFIKKSRNEIVVSILIAVSGLSIYSSLQSNGSSEVIVYFQGAKVEGKVIESQEQVFETMKKKNYFPEEIYKECGLDYAQRSKTSIFGKIKPDVNKLTNTLSIRNEGADVDATLKCMNLIAEFILEKHNRTITYLIENLEQEIKNKENYEKKLGELIKSKSKSQSELKFDSNVKYNLISLEESMYRIQEGIREKKYSLKYDTSRMKYEIEVIKTSHDNFKDKILKIIMKSVVVGIVFGLILSWLKSLNITSTQLKMKS